MSCLIFKCTIDETYINKRKKELFLEYNQVIKYCSDAIKFFIEPFCFHWMWSSLAVLIISYYSKTDSLFSIKAHHCPYALFILLWNTRTCISRRPLTSSKYHRFTNSIPVWLSGRVKILYADYYNTHRLVVRF